MKRPDVEYAEPLNFASLIAQASEAAKSQYRDQVQTMVDYYPKLERLQLRTIDKLAGKLDNAYTQEARAAAQDALGQRALIGAQGDRLAGIGDYVAGQALMNYEQSGPTSIERRLYGDAEAEMAAGASPIERRLMADAERELALGRTLTGEELRDAQQSARSAFAARGLGTSAGGTAAEILNREQMARAREDQRRQFAMGAEQYATGQQAGRRNFASAANQMMTQNVMARRDQSANQAALGANLMQGAAGLYGNVANIGFAGASALPAIDPYYRAMSPGLQASGNTQANMMQGIGQTYGSTLGMAGNVASFNANMLDSRANSQMNNWAAMRSAGMQAGAMNNAATMGMISGIGQGVLQGAGFALSDKREKKEIKPLGKSASVLGLKTYSYKYKGDDKQRIGVMAQDVQKVLPEAVEEVDYKGKKRLAIKPAVIGAALAEELAAQAA